MRFPYTAVGGFPPQPTLGGGTIRYRPLVPILVGFHGAFHPGDFLVDSGADDTVITAVIAAALRIDLARLPTRTVSLIGRPPQSYSVGLVTLRMTDGREVCEWDATILISSGPMRYGLLGHAGGLEHFLTKLDGGGRETEVAPGSSYPGLYSTRP